MVILVVIGLMWLSYGYCGCYIVIEVLVIVVMGMLVWLLNL